jgi:DNA-binding response OmpR family regulator
MEENRSMNVLVADDEANFRQIFKDLLKSEKYNILCASNPEETIKKVLDYDVHVILLDKRFPSDADGLQVLRRIKELKPQAEVIMLTAYPESKSNLEAMESGAAAYLIKTDDYGKLVNTVNHLVEITRLRSRNEELVKELQERNKKLTDAQTTMSAWNNDLQKQMKRFYDFEAKHLKNEMNPDGMSNSDLFALGLVSEMNDQVKIARNLVTEFHGNPGDDLVTSIAKMGSLTQNMTEISSSYSCIALPQPKEKTLFEFALMLQKVGTVLRLLGEVKGAEIRVSGVETLPAFYGHPRKMANALLNIGRKFLSQTEGPLDGKILTFSSGITSREINLQFSLLSDRTNEQLPDSLSPVFSEASQLPLDLISSKMIIEEHQGKMRFSARNDILNSVDITFPLRIGA